MIQRQSHRRAVFKIKGDFFMTSMEEDISQYYKNQNLISIERMIYKELGFGMDEISAVWRYSPLLYRLKFFFKKEKINAFVKRFAFVFPYR